MIRNIYEGKIEQSLVELYIEKLSKRVGGGDRHEEMTGGTSPNVGIATHLEIHTC